MVTHSKASAPRIHFIGIGGIGMSGLARYFKALKWVVSGSDAAKSPMTAELIKDGIRVKIGHKTANLPKGPLMVVYNRAIRPGSPGMIELDAALARKDAVTLPYSVALGRVTKDYETIAITGSHGKSTTTALAGITLMKARLDPTILVGTKLADLRGKNIRVGKGPYLVLEADDYGAAFLDYSPAIAVVTNIDREHMDFYKTEAKVKNAFFAFLGKTRDGGTLILNRDDAPLRSLAVRISGLARKKHFTVTWCSLKEDAPLADKIHRALPIPGTHNVSNALLVMKLGHALGIPEAKVLGALRSYRGAWRRMEYKGSAAIAGASGGVKVFDDYAHHPSEIKATLSAFREKFPRSPLICVFQPHQAKRLEVLFKDFIVAFDEADCVFLLPLYKVLGRDERSPHDSAALARAITERSRGKAVFYLDDPKRIRTAVREAVKNVPLFKAAHFSRPPVIIMMGAGDIVDLTARVLKK